MTRDYRDESIGEGKASRVPPPRVDLKNGPAGAPVVAPTVLDPSLGRLTRRTQGFVVLLILVVGVIFALVFVALFSNSSHTEYDDSPMALEELSVEPESRDRDGHFGIRFSQLATHSPYIRSIPELDSLHSIHLRDSYLSMASSSVEEVVRYQLSQAEQDLLTTPAAALPMLLGFEAQLRTISPLEQMTSETIHVDGALAAQAYTYGPFTGKYEKAMNDSFGVRYLHIYAILTKTAYYELIVHDLSGFNAFGPEFLASFRLYQDHATPVAGPSHLLVLDSPE